MVFLPVSVQSHFADGTSLAHFANERFRHFAVSKFYVRIIFRFEGKSAGTSVAIEGFYLTGVDFAVFFQVTLAAKVCIAKSASVNFSTLTVNCGSER